MKEPLDFRLARYAWRFFRGALWLVFPVPFRLAIRSRWLCRCWDWWHEDWRLRVSEWCLVPLGLRGAHERRMEAIRELLFGPESER